MEAIVAEQRSLAKRIASMPATTVAGLQVRALILAEMLDEEEDEDDYTDDLMIRALVRDLVAMKCDRGTGRRLRPPPTYHRGQAVQRSDRQARLERAKAAGRAAYRLTRDAAIFGFIEIDGERKLLREFDHGVLKIELYEAAGRPSCEDDFSQLRIHHAGQSSRVQDRSI